MLLWPDVKSTKPELTLTPDRSSAYGLNVEKMAGAVPGDDGSCEPYTLTSSEMPAPDPTMMLSALDPSICVAVTLTPPCAPGANAANRVSSVPNACLPPCGFPE